MKVIRICGLVLAGARATVSTRYGGRVRRCFTVLRAYPRMTFWVDQAASPWRSFLVDMASLRCVYSGSLGKNTLFME